VDLAIFVVALLVVGGWGLVVHPLLFHVQWFRRFLSCLIVVCHRTYVVVASSSFVLL